MNDKPNKIYFTYEQGADGNIVIKDVVILSENGFTREEFNPERHFGIIEDFFRENGVSSVEEAEERGIFARFDANTVDKAAVDSFVGVESDPTPSDSDEEPVTEEEPPVVVVPPVVESEEPVAGDDPVEPTPDTGEYGLDDDEQYTQPEEVEEDHRVLKRVGAGVLAGAAAIGMLAMLHSCSEQQINNQKDENEDDLYKNMTDEQRAFFEPTFKAVEQFNKRAGEEGTFKLAEDDTTLHITVDEAIALNIIMNDYSADELYAIFGTLEFDTNNIMNLARSAYAKLSTYYMNAKEASGLSQIIRDEDARAFFESHENAVIAFNNNPSTELSDKVIKGLYYDYVHGGSTGAYAQINNDGVAWFATSAGFGFELANRNVEEFLRINGVSEAEIEQYGKAAASVGMPLSKITTSELLTGINEEIDLDVMDEVDNKSLCAAVTTQTRDRVEALRLKQQIAVTIVRADAKGRLVEGLQNIGASSLANKVMAADINLDGELLEEIRSHNASADSLVEEYSTRIGSITDKEALVVAVMELAQEKFGLTSEIDIADLINNRFRTREKVKDQSTDKKPTTSTTISREDLDKLDKDEKKEYIKDNGTVIKTETTTTQVEVEEEDLTPEEKKDVVAQTAILEEIQQMKNKLISKGSADAITYTEEKGAYDYNKTIVNPNNKEVIDTDNLSLFNIVAHATAFGDGAEAINSSDAQVQARMKKDAEKVTSMISSLSDEAKAYLKAQYGSDWQEEFIRESYISGYTGQIDGSLKVARQMGEELKKSAEEAYKKAQAALNSTTQTTTTTTPTTSTTQPTTGTTTTVDPNIGEQFGEDEIPFVPNHPVSYVSDGAMVTETEWDLAFSSEPVEPARAPRVK